MLLQELVERQRALSVARQVAGRMSALHPGSIMQTTAEAQVHVLVVALTEFGQRVVAK